ncbi:unnamed protein product [Dicrocoelium dendriticum]|nr:unnamed protein product [Dicrocoelium dendriticum]
MNRFLYFACRNRLSLLLLSDFVVNYPVTVTKAAEPNLRVHSCSDQFTWTSLLNILASPVWVNCPHGSSTYDKESYVPECFPVVRTF